MRRYVEIVRDYITDCPNIPLSKLTTIQQKLFKCHIMAFVSMNPSTGYFMPNVYVLNREKSKESVPYYERLTTPYSFREYEDALKASIMRGIEYYLTAELCSTVKN